MTALLELQVHTRIITTTYHRARDLQNGIPPRVTTPVKATTSLPRTITTTTCLLRVTSRIIKIHSHLREAIRIKFQRKETIKTLFPVSLKITSLGRVITIFLLKILFPLRVTTFLISHQTPLRVSSKETTSPHKARSLPRTTTTTTFHLKVPSLRVHKAVMFHLKFLLPTLLSLASPLKVASLHKVPSLLNPPFPPRETTFPLQVASLHKALSLPSPTFHRVPFLKAASQLPRAQTHLRVPFTLRTTTSSPKITISHPSTTTFRTITTFPKTTFLRPLPP